MTKCQYQSTYLTNTLKTKKVQKKILERDEWFGMVWGKKKKKKKKTDKDSKVLSSLWNIVQAGNKRH